MAPPDDAPRGPAGSRLQHDHAVAAMKADRRRSPIMRFTRLWLAVLAVVETALIIVTVSVSWLAATPDLLLGAGWPILAACLATTAYRSGWMDSHFAATPSRQDPVWAALNRLLDESSVALNRLLDESSLGTAAANAPWVVWFVVSPDERRLLEVAARHQHETLPVFAHKAVIRLANDLVDHYGADAVVQEVGSLGPGEDSHGREESNPG